ncbi:hypothetical protein [Hymenobacter arizonensis]|uniref:hypothetical protein n=1 Tax=Hymenobacter arizonensis TaxID=1227077 RepID=UPI0015A6153E|nr:hypothetical protein [Hymenobacter arizonensis]
MLSAAEPKVAVGKHLARFVRNSCKSSVMLSLRSILSRLNDLVSGDKVLRRLSMTAGAVKMLAYGDLRFGCAQHDVCCAAFC